MDSTDAKQFAAFARRHPDLTRQSFAAFAERMRHENPLRVRNEPIPVTPWPAVIPVRQAAQLAADLETVSRLVAGLGSRIFGGDLKTHCRTFGFTEEQERIFAATYGDDQALLARADAYEGADGFKMLELNFGASGPALEMDEVARALMATPAFRAFAPESGAVFVPMGERLVETIATAARNRGLDPRRMTLAIMDWAPAMKSWVEAYKIMASLLARAGIRTIVLDQNEVTVSQEGLYHLGLRVDAVFRIFQTTDLAGDGPRMQAIAELARDGKLLILNGNHAEIMLSKANLALLSDERYQTAYTSVERAAIGRLLPWTRFVRQERVRWRGEEVDMLDLLARQPGAFVLKQCQSMGGAGVVAGWTCGVERFAAVVEEALSGRSGPWIVQERVEPRVVSVPVLDGQDLVERDYFVNWGFFVFDHRYAGAVTRLCEQSGVAVFNTANSAAVGCGFTEQWTGEAV